MPNRIIKESICTSESVNSLGWYEQAFFVRLLVHADDYGRVDGRPMILRSWLFPLSTGLELEQVQAAVSALCAAGLVACYEVEGRPYIWIKGWANHQRIRNQRSKYPPPPTLPEPKRAAGNPKLIEFRPAVDSALKECQGSGGQESQGSGGQDGHNGEGLRAVDGGARQTAASSNPIRIQTGIQSRIQSQSSGAQPGADIPEELLKQVCEQAVGRLNSLAGTAYRPQAKLCRQLVKKRMEEGFVLKDFIQVVDNKYADWGTLAKGGKDMRRYLRPETLFSEKFEGYLNQPVNKAEKAITRKLGVKI